MGRKKVEINPKTGERLQYLLHKYQMTHKQLAGYIRYAEQFISYVIHGQRALNADTARKIVELFPPTRYEWLLGEDDAETYLDLQFQEIFQFSADRFRKINIDSFLEHYIILNAPRCGYVFENKEKDLSYKELSQKRSDLLLRQLKDKYPEEMIAEENFDGILNSLTKNKHSDMSFVSEEYNIKKDSEIVASCDSNEIKKLSDKLSAYLGYLIYEYVQQFQHNKEELQS